MFDKLFFKKPIIFGLILLSILFFFSSAHPQRDYQNDLKKAEGLLNDGKYPEAIEILEPLYSKYPDYPEVISFMKRAYYEGKYYSDLILFLEKLVEKNPHDWRLWTELGENELRLGQVEKAEKSFSRAIEKGHNFVEAYQRIAMNYRAKGLNQKATQIYKLGNENLKGKVFSLELANLYQNIRDYKSCVEEYLSFVENDPKRFEIVEKGMKNLIQFGDDLEGIEKALEGAIQKDSTNKYAYKLYGDLLVIKGELKKAFEIYKVVDFMWEGRGGYILNFAQKCYEKSLFQLSFEACEYLLSDYRNPLLLNKARLCKGNSLKGLGKFEDAIEIYQEIIRDQNKGEELILSYFNIGEIKYKKLNQAKEALQWYKKAIIFTDSPVYPEALVRSGDCLLSTGELDSASFWFMEILGDPQTQEKREEIRFKLGEIDFFRGEFKNAQEKYQRLVSDFPKGFYVNNSLERIAILRENIQNNPLGLLVFSQALFEEVKRNRENSISLFNKLVDSQDPFLSDDSELQIGYILRKNGDFNGAILKLEKIVKDYPQSPFCALAQKLIGDIYYYDLNDLVNAEKAYLSVLKNFSSSLFVEEARVNLKRINQEKVEG